MSRALESSVVRASAARVLADWASLTRPRIVGFVYFASLVGALLTTPALAGGPGPFEAAGWIALSAAAASAFNQFLERGSDGLMQRTASRPLPTGRVRPRDALLFAAVLGGLATAGLALRFNVLAALLALATLALYALVYTPLKRISSLNTLVGAFPGAMPPLLGAVALGGAPSAWGWWLFAIVFAWQFPHFMAIGWIYREDYARAGIRVLPALQGGRAVAGLQALAYSLVLVPVSLVPVLDGRAGMLYALAACALGAGYVLASLRFARGSGECEARALLRYSLVYLPLVFAAVLLDPHVRQLSAPATDVSRAPQASSLFPGTP